MRQTIGRVINRLLKPTGYRFARRGQLAQDTTLEAALTRVTGRGLEVKTVIDVGASNGQWTRAVRPFFPGAAWLLIEANPVHEADLQRFKQEFAGVAVVLAAAGDTVGEIYFDNSDPLSGLASHEPLAGPSITVPVTTIDAQVAERGLQPPFLIKLDTHGFEVPILEGARQTLQHANLLIIEAYNFQLRPGTLKYYELCQLLSTWGFETIDFCDPLFRTRDHAFWQFDLFFIRAEREEFKNTSYD